MFIRLKDWEERGSKLSATALSQKLSGALAMALPEANAFVIAPPAVQGLGNGNGFMMMIEGRSGQSYHDLEKATQAMMGAAAQNDQVTQDIGRASCRERGWQDV